MAIVKISSKLTINSCESFLRSIQQNEEEECIVNAPTNISHSLAGGEISFTQAICTWARSVANSVVSTHIQGDDPSQIEKFTRSIFGQACSFNAQTILDKTETDITESVRRAALAQIRQSHNQPDIFQVKGTEVHILCVDHLGLGTPKLLYSDEPNLARVVRSRSEFQQIAANIVKRLSQTKDYGLNTKSFISGLGALLYETFKNTEDHALKGLGRIRLMNSLRGFQAKFVSMKQEDLTSISSEFQPLNEFFTEHTKESTQKTFPFFELTIFDSGIGFASTYTKLPRDLLLPKEELLAIKHCFEIGKSSKERSGYGFGLARVEEILKERKGFLRLRTGRFSMYKDYSLSKNEELQFQLWHNDAINDSVLSPVEGALITILIPFKV